MPAHEEAPATAFDAAERHDRGLLFGSLEHCRSAGPRCRWRRASAAALSRLERAGTLLGGPPREFAQGVPALILGRAAHRPEICLISATTPAPVPPRELDDDLARRLRAYDADDVDADIGAAADAASARAAAVAAGTVKSGALGERVGGLDAALGEVAGACSRRERSRTIWSKSPA